MENTAAIRERLVQEYAGQPEHLLARLKGAEGLPEESQRKFGITHNRGRWWFTDGYALNDVPAGLSAVLHDVADYFGISMDDVCCGEDLCEVVCNRLPGTFEPFLPGGTLVVAAYNGQDWIGYVWPLDAALHSMEGHLFVLNQHMDLDAAINWDGEVE